MTLEASAFDDHFPQGCPPDMATSASGNFYRLVCNSPPQPVDFQTHHEKNARGGDACERCGLSVYLTQSEAAELYRFFARKHGVQGTRIGPYIAKLELTADHGKIKPTPRKADSHHTWWPYKQSDRATSFVEVVEVASL